MEQNKYVTLHSLLRMAAALIAIIVFISMFIAKQIDDARGSYTWNEVFFGSDINKATVVGFVGYVLVFIGGLAGLAFVFVDEIIGKDLTKTLSFVTGGVMVFGAIMMLFTGVMFRAINNLSSEYTLASGPIVFAILSMIAGAANIAAPVLEDKGL